MPENTESTSVPKNTESTGVPKNTASTNVLENTKSAYDYLFDGDRAFYSSYGLQNATDVKKFMDSPGGDSMKTAVAGELARLDEERKRGLSDTEGQLKRQRILVALVIAKEKNSARDPQIPNEYDKNVKNSSQNASKLPPPTNKDKIESLNAKIREFKCLRQGYSIRLSKLNRYHGYIQSAIAAKKAGKKQLEPLMQLAKEKNTPLNEPNVVNNFLRKIVIEEPDSPQQKMAKQLCLESFRVGKGYVAAFDETGRRVPADSYNPFERCFFVPSKDAELMEKELNKYESSNDYTFDEKLRLLFDTHPDIEIELNQKAFDDSSLELTEHMEERNERHMEKVSEVMERVDKSIESAKEKAKQLGSENVTSEHAEKNENNILKSKL